MSEQQSALDAWASLADDPSSRQTVAFYIPVILSAAGALGVAPFAVIRWLTADWGIAVLDTTIVAGFVFLGTFVYRTRRVRFASALIAMLCVLGTLVTLQVRGPQQAYWAYPSMMACFYLVKPRAAIAMTLTMAAVMCAQLFGSIEPFRLAAILSTLVVTMAFAFAFSVLNARQQDRLIAMANHDPLTGAGNRRAYLARLAEAIARFDRTRSPASLVLVDIDHFKSINDRHGHTIGDAVLREVARLIDSRTRSTEPVYRIGGEEFVVIVDGSGETAAMQLAEDLRRRIKAIDLLPDHTITASIGIAEIRRRDTEEAWLHRADEALYAAKNAGRDSVRLAR